MTRKLNDRKTVRGVLWSNGKSLVSHLELRVLKNTHGRREFNNWAKSLAILNTSEFRLT